MKFCQIKGKSIMKKAEMQVYSHESQIFTGEISQRNH